jgi:hypothetical protein
MCREATTGRTDPVEADRTTIRSLPNHSSRARSNQDSSIRASCEHAPLLACWSGGPSPKKRTSQRCGGSVREREEREESEESEDTRGPSVEPRTGSSGTCDWTALCSNLRGGILGAMRHEGGMREARGGMRGGAKPSS